MKKTYIIVGIIFLLFIVSILILRVLTLKKNSSIHPDQVKTGIFAPTIPFTKDLQEKQTQADVDFGKWQAEKLQKYPWIDELPLSNEKFYVYFDIDLKEFVAALYVSSSDIETTKEEVQSALRNKGIPADNFDFKWDIHLK